MAQRRVNLILLGAFAMGALLMAAIGVYGVVAFAMASRTREIGVRMVLGASGRDIAKLGTLQGAAPVLIGVVGGIAGCLLSGRALRGLLFGVGSNDPATLALSTTVVTRRRPDRRRRPDTAGHANRSASSSSGGVDPGRVNPLRSGTFGRCGRH